MVEAAVLLHDHDDVFDVAEVAVLVAVVAVLGLVALAGLEALLGRRTGDAGGGGTQGGRTGDGDGRAQEFSAGKSGHSRFLRVGEHPDTDPALLPEGVRDPTRK
ncbi:hypothetical protein ACFQ51_42850 [Streptomyces kaempferi]